MKMTIDRATFSGVLDKVARIVDRRNTIPILSNVRLTFDGQRLSATATDLDVQATAVAEALEPGEPFDTTVEAARISEVARKLPDGRVRLEGDDTGIALCAGRTRIRLNTLPATDFPVMEAPNDATAFSVDRSVLATMLAKALHTVSSEEARYYLNGVFLHLASADDGGDLLRAVATDGHRLSRISVPAPAGTNGMPGVIIPTKTVEAVLRLLKSGDGVEVAVSTGKIEIAFGDGTRLLSKLIDGTFPEYQRVIPTGNYTRVVIPTAPLTEALGRVTAVATERGRAVRFTVSAGELTLEITNPDHGSAVDQIDVEGDSEIATGFNSAYAAGLVSNAGAPRCTWSFGDPGGPCVIEPLRAPGDGTEGPGDVESTRIDELYVLMPMRV